MSGLLDDELLDTLVVDGVEVQVWGLYDPHTTPENQWEGFDLYVDGECINLGEPLPYRPAPIDIRPFLTERRP